MAKVQYPALVSVVIPCYRPTPSHLRETLESVINQTLDPWLYEIIVVDDASDDDEALGLVNEYRELTETKIEFVKHEENKWLAAARTTGAELSEAEYIVFLDDDDLLDPDYLEKALLLITATPYADWVYTNHRKFGQRNELKIAGEFAPLRFSLRNNMSYSSMFRRQSWLEAGQRKLTVTGNIKQFEDWDMYIRMMGSGKLGTPLQDTRFHYRKSTSGLAARSARAYILSIYKLYRSNAAKLFRLPAATIRHRRHKRRGFSRLHFFHPARPIDQFIRYLARRFAYVYELPALIDLRTSFFALFRPKKFSDIVMNDKSTLSLSAMRSAFEGPIDISFTKQRQFPSRSPNNTIVAAHIWWQMGGAENIYWYWLKAAKSVSGGKLVNVVSQDDKVTGVLKQHFAKLSDTQYDLSSFGETPLQKLRSAWNLIDYERPKVIFISSNSYFYQLIPYIKQEFPSIKIIDILHNEYDGFVDWYTISADYIDLIDKRIVTSPYWRDLLIEKYNVEPDGIILARNPVDTEIYDPALFKRDKILKSFRLSPKQKIISFIGRLHPQKGLDVFLELAESMHDNPDFRFVVVGDGELLDMVKDKVKTLKNLNYRGYFRTVERVLAMTDILICPSLYEGAPLIGLEAAAMNTAVVAPNLVGFKEQIEEGNFGLLYEASLEVQIDVSTLKEMLEERHAELLELAQNGRPFILEKHAFSVVGKQYESALSSLFNPISSEPSK